MPKLRAGLSLSGVVPLVLGGAVVVGGVAGGFVAAPEAAARPAPRIVNPIAFGDTFDNGRRDGWTVVDETRAHGPSRWTVRKSSLRQASNVFAGTGRSVAKRGTEIVGGNPTWRDYDFGVSARSLDDDALGVVFRFVDRNNYYRFSIDRQRGVRQLVAKVNGHYRVLAQNHWKYAKNHVYRLRIRAVGGDLRAYVGGHQVLAAHDVRLTHGRFGMYTWGNPARFDSVRASVASPGAFTIAVLPDTQFESESRPSMFRAQTRWLAQHRATRNIVAVLHEGDVVNRLEQPRQWRNARRALNYVAGKIPLIVAAGNHDLQLQHHKPARTRPRAFDRMVGSLPDYHVSGRYQHGSWRNTYQLLSAGGVRFVIVNLTYGPSNKQLAWAGRIADRYRDRHVIMLTHDYLGQHNQWRGGPGDRSLPSKSAPGHNDGIDIWRKFVRRHANVQFTFNGHVNQKTRGRDFSVGRRVSTNRAGRAVYQVLTNFQTTHRGNGYLRLVRFDPARGTVSYSTYSPYLDRSLTGSDNYFAFHGVALG